MKTYFILSIFAMCFCVSAQAVVLGAGGSGKGECTAKGGVTTPAGAAKSCGEITDATECNKYSNCKWVKDTGAGTVLIKGHF